MPGGQAAVARATAAVFADGRRAGSAVLVGPRYLVTAAHVLQRWDPDARATEAVEQVELEFPDQGPGGQPGRTAAALVDLGPAGAGVDVAVLDLGEDRPGWLPSPVPVWSAARPPARVQVFGYPLAERLLKGVWRQFAVAGPAAAGTVQLDWIGDAGTFPGHSGGPVIDAEGHALAGILVEGAERGRFDRFVPITLIARTWPGLPRPWVMTGAEPSEARSHFTRRARGQRSAARGGDLFRGRAVALDFIRGWLTAGEPPGQPLVITGQPGSGKSAVLARAALSVEARHGGPGLAFHARAATIGDFLTTLADLTGVDTSASADELVTSLADLPGQSSVPVVLDALDEAASDHDRRQIAETLAELAVLPWLRVAVATRPLAAGNPFAPGGLLPALGVFTRDDHKLIDLDNDTYFSPEDVRDFAAAVLMQQGADRPGPRGGAWETYRADRGMCQRLATAIGQRAGRNFLVAAMAAAPLSTRIGTIDPAQKGFNPSAIPSSIGEALSKYFDHSPRRRRACEHGLLTALAYARGDGLDDDTWLGFAAALSYPATATDLDMLRRSPTADYLLQATSTKASARPVTRLFHQALTDEFRSERHQPSDESRVIDFILGRATTAGWTNIYFQQHTAEHAVAAGRLDELLGRLDYLLSADPTRLVPYLGAAQSETAHITARVYRQTAHLLSALDPPTRASQLELSACHLGYKDLASRIAAAAPLRPWQARWFKGSLVSEHQTLIENSGIVKSVAVSTLPDGTAIVIGGEYRGKVWLRRLADGVPVAELVDPLPPPSGVKAVAMSTLLDGTPVIVVHSGILQVRRLDDGAYVARLSASDAVIAVAVGTLPDGPPFIVTGSRHGTVEVWRLAEAPPVAKWKADHKIFMEAMALGALPDGTPIIITGGDPPAVQVRRLADGTLVTGPFDDHEHPFHNRRGPALSVAIGALPDGTPVIVSGGRDGYVVMRRLSDGEPTWRAHSGRISVKSLAIDSLRDGTPIVVSGHNDGRIRVWRLADGTLVGGPLVGHRGSVNSVAVGALPDNTPIIVSGGDDGTVRLWPLADTTPGMGRFSEDLASATAVATGTLSDGTPVIVSGSEDGTVAVWRLADGTAVTSSFTGHKHSVNALVVNALPDGTPVIVSGGEDGEVAVWRLSDGASISRRRASQTSVHSLATGVLADGTRVIVSGATNDTARLWHSAGNNVQAWRFVERNRTIVPISADDYSYQMMAHGYHWVTTLTMGTLPDGTPVIVSGHYQGNLTVWRLADGARVAESVASHRGRVDALEISTLADGTQVIVSGDTYGSLAVWRLADGACIAGPVVGHKGQVYAIKSRTLPDGTPIFVSGGLDGKLKVWRLADGASLDAPLQLPAYIRCIALHKDIVVAATSNAIEVQRFTFPRADLSDGTATVRSIVPTN